MADATIRGWRDGTSMTVPGFDPAQHTTKESAAKALYESLRKLAEMHGMNPDTEVCIRTPDETEEQGYGRFWWVMWEAGPYMWASSAYFGGTWGYCETYWGFDCQFID